MHWLCQIAWAVVLATVAGCGGSSPDNDDCGEAAPFTQPGPHVAGVTTIMRADVPVEVWYPAEPGAEAGVSEEVYDLRNWLPQDVADEIPDEEAPLRATGAYRDIPASSGRFPLVLFSHGLGGYRTQSSFLMVHLATWGFVVVAPEHPERGLAAVLAGEQLGDDSIATLRDVLVMLEEEDAKPGGPLEGRLDFDRVTVSGHSMGGAAAMVVAADEGIHAWFTMATLASGTTPGKPGLLMAGVADGVADIEQVVEEFEKKDPPKRFVSLEGAGHLAFTDICTISRDQGGLLGLAQKYGVEIDEMLVTLGTDGCGQDNLPAEEGWPVINHFVTAHLRAAFGLDDPPRGLDNAAAACFAGIVGEFTQQ
jgi:dienelactone hydrolase